MNAVKIKTSEKCWGKSQGYVHRIPVRAFEKAFGNQIWK